MLALLSPSKTLDASPSPLTLPVTSPDLLEHSLALLPILRELSPDALGELMQISPRLADLNYERFRTFTVPFTAENAKPALLAFKGDVYEGLNAADFTEKELIRADRHIRILSGFYGFLRPLDLMQPYRLEMGVSLANPKGANLYAFWKGTLTDTLNRHVKETGTKHVINLASREYASAVEWERLAVPALTIHFKERKNGAFKTIGLFAKKARGMMARFMVKENIATLKDLQNFNEGGYTFLPEHSSEKEWTFAR